VEIDNRTASGRVSEKISVASQPYIIVFLTKCNLRQNEKAKNKIFHSICKNAHPVSREAPDGQNEKEGSD
jgi:hypothetical protein